KPRGNFLLAGQTYTAGKKWFQFAEEARLMSVAELRLDTFQRAGNQRRRPALFVPLLLVKRHPDASAFARVERLNGMNFLIQEHELMIAATLDCLLSVPHVRDVVLECRKQERAEFALPAVCVHISLALQQIGE